jgi:MoxR-like ATPase
MVGLCQSLSGRSKQQLPRHSEVNAHRGSVTKQSELLASTNEFADHIAFQQQIPGYSRLGPGPALGAGPAPAAGRIVWTRHHISPMHRDGDDAKADHPPSDACADLFNLGEFRHYPIVRPDFGRVERLSPRTTVPNRTGMIQTTRRRIQLASHQHRSPAREATMPDPLASQPAIQATEPEQAIGQVRDAHAKLRAEIAKVVVGQDEVVDLMLMTLFCGGHALVVGVPGLAKTLLISTIARSLSLGFSRIQFTPDLMPSDITGTEVIEEDKTTGSRELRFVKGPIFANVILADEINRTPPKTQAALLEAMQEHQVTTAGVQHKLPEPFFVLATQNPIEQEGTYPLPEAQLDRFMFNITIGYPDEEEEVEIIRRTTSTQVAQPQPCLTSEDVLKVQQLVREAPVADHVIRYALRLVRSTRIKEHSADNPKPQIVRDYLAWGAGPRAGQNLILAAKAKAVLSGSFHVTPEHVKSVAKPVLRHRIICNFNAEADGVTTDDVIDRLLKDTPVDGAGPGEKRQMDAVLN